MALKFNDTEVKKVVFNGVEKSALIFNGACYFCRQFTLTQQLAVGTSLRVTRTSSPYQKGGNGTLYSGNPIYYGDSLTIICGTMTGYTNPELLVDIGDGKGLLKRENPFTFTVVGNVTYKGTAQSNVASKEWVGSRTFTSSGSFNVPGLENYSRFEVTARVEFESAYFDDSNYYPEDEFSKDVNDKALPSSIYGYYSYVYLTGANGRIDFIFNPYEEYLKGFGFYETPLSITFTKIKGMV